MSMFTLWTKPIMITRIPHSQGFFIYEGCKRKLARSSGLCQDASSFCYSTGMLYFYDVAYRGRNKNYQPHKPIIEKLVERAKIKYTDYTDTQSYSTMTYTNIYK